jgi:hypothetical protein
VGLRDSIQRLREDIDSNRIAVWIVDGWWIDDGGWIVDGGWIGFMSGGTPELPEDKDGCEAEITMPDERRGLSLRRECFQPGHRRRKE